MHAAEPKSDGKRPGAAGGSAVARTVLREAMISRWLPRGFYGPDADMSTSILFTSAGQVERPLGGAPQGLSSRWRSGWRSVG
jgi:hypothetical protein